MTGPTMAALRRRSTIRARLAGCGPTYQALALRVLYGETVREAFTYSAAAHLAREDVTR